jgi:hypothetical protein
MTLRYLLLWAVLGLFSPIGVFAQVNKWQYTMPNDSLKGFDEDYYKQRALAEGLFGQDFTGFMM